MGPLLRIVGLVMVLGGLFLLVQAIDEGTISGMVFSVALLAIGAYALISGASESGASPRASGGAGFSSVPGPPPRGRPDSKVCPDCAEAVNSAARKCRYCGYMFDESTIVAPPSVPPLPNSSASTGAHERLARTLGIPGEDLASTSDPGASSKKFTPPRGFDLYKAGLRASIRTPADAWLRSLSPAYTVTSLRLFRTYGRQWCGQCGELLMPRISAWGQVDELWRCSGCGISAPPVPRPLT